MHLELIVSILGSAAIMVWRLAVFASEQKRHREIIAEHEKQIDRLRTWKHDRVNPVLQELLWDKDERRDFDVEDTRNHQLPSVKK